MADSIAANACHIDPAGRDYTSVNSGDRDRKHAVTHENTSSTDFRRAGTYSGHVDQGNQAVSPGSIHPQRRGIRAVPPPAFWDIVVLFQAVSNFPCLLFSGRLRMGLAFFRFVCSRIHGPSTSSGRTAMESTTDRPELVEGLWRPRPIVLSSSKGASRRAVDQLI